MYSARLLAREAGFTLVADASRRGLEIVHIAGDRDLLLIGRDVSDAQILDAALPRLDMPSIDRVDLLPMELRGFALSA